MSGFMVRAVCGAWHPVLFQPWGPPPACRLDAGHDGEHEGLYATETASADITWPAAEATDDWTKP